MVGERESTKFASPIFSRPAGEKKDMTSYNTAPSNSKYKSEESRTKIYSFFDFFDFFAFGYGTGKCVSNAPSVKEEK